MKNLQIYKNNEFIYAHIKMHKVNVSEPWFSLISMKKKKVEGRLNKGSFALMKEGDIIEFSNGEIADTIRTCKVVITKIVKYDTFAKYLKKEKLKNCLPTITDIDTGVKVYRKFYSEEMEREYKVLAIRFKAHEMV